MGLLFTGSRKPLAVADSLGNWEYNGKKPEECSDINTKGTMQDIHYLLMQQCLRDARSLYPLLMHFDGGSSPYLNSWGIYETNVITMAQTLFAERNKNPVTLDQLKQILAVGESTLETLSEVKFNNEESLHLIQEIEQLSTKRTHLTKEIETVQKNIAGVKSADFLRTTIGDSLYNQFVTTGILKISGTNGSTYIIDNQGDITKKVAGLFGTSDKWQGKIHPGKYPLYDAIATVVVHIREDSDKFDRDKKCGNISIL